MEAPEFNVRRRRKPSRLALQLTDAFSTLDEWSEVKVVRDASGRRDRVVHLHAFGATAHPYDWSQAA